MFPYRAISVRLNGLLVVLTLLCAITGQVFSLQDAKLELQEKILRCTKMDMELVNRVYETRDLQLIAMCLENTNLAYLITALTEKDTDKKFREQTLAMTLRSRGRWVGLEDELAVMRSQGGFVSQWNEANYYHGILKQYFSEEKLRQYSLYSPKNRIQLAEMFEKMVGIAPQIAAATTDHTFARKVWPPDPTDKTGAKSAAGGESGALPNASAADVVGTTPAFLGHWGWAAAASATAILAGAGAWQICRRRRKG